MILFIIFIKNSLDNFHYFYYLRVFSHSNGMAIVRWPYNCIRQKASLLLSSFSTYYVAITVDTSHQSMEALPRFIEVSNTAPF